MRANENELIKETADVDFCGLHFSINGYGGDYIFEYIKSSGKFYEEDLLKMLAYLDLKRFEIIDVGANLGNHTINFACSHPDSAVTAIEPMSQNLEVLRENVLGNGLSDRVTILEAAAGDSQAALRLRKVDPANMGAVSVEYAGEMPSDGPIRQISLDDLDLPNQVGLIKIDVEGFEPKVLRGAMGVIRKSRPVLVTEAHSPFSYREISRLLAPFDYVPISIKGRSNNFIWVAPGPVLDGGQFDQYIYLINSLDRRNARSAVL